MQIDRRIRAMLLAMYMLATAGSASAGDSSIADLLKQLNRVGPENAGQREASAVWRKLAGTDPNQLPLVLAGLDNAGPLAANWIATAAESIAERADNNATPLPRPELERFLFDRSHAPRARRLAYEILLGGDPALAYRVLPKMLDDPCLEMRRDAVARVIAEADRLAAATPVDTPKTVAEYEKALDAARDLDQVKHAADQLRHFGAKVDMARHFGFITDWQLIGPFDNRDKKGYAASYPPERQVDLTAVVAGKNGDMKWRPFSTSDEFGQVDLNRAIHKELGVVAYALAEFDSEQARPVELRMATENACKLWLNGKLLFGSEVYHSFTAMDQFVSRGELKAGRNQILVKICQNEQTEDWAQVWQFQLRVCDSLGKGLLSKSLANTAGGER
ncbi:MAG TPA: hypothetical protein VKB78_02350 [Pirellulales bacterium]|nr:hypothetical protein [Pirellulales bacterium]